VIGAILALVWGWILIMLAQDIWKEIKEDREWEIKDKTNKEKKRNVPE